MDNTSLSGDCRGSSCPFCTKSGPSKLRLAFRTHLAESSMLDHTPPQPHPSTLPRPSTLCPCFRSKPFPPHLGPLLPAMPPGPLSAFTLHPPRHLLEPRSDVVDACPLDTFQRSPLETGQARGVAPPTWSPHLSHLPPCPLPTPTLLPGPPLTDPVQDPHILRIPLHMVREVACLAPSGHSRQR